MSVIQNNLLLAGDDAYNLNRSLRFRSSASAYLSRTLTTPTNQKIWTYSTWLKRGTINTADCLFSSSDNYNAIRFVDTNGALIIYGDSGGSMNIETASLYRDPSAWYHIVVAFDSTQATSSNRVKIYVNGSQVTSFTTATYPSLNATYGFNSAIAHAIGRRQSTSNCYLDGYLSELNFIDGQALTPSSFGETNAQTGVWQPKKYSGAYGTNGFYLPFTDNSALTSGSNAGLGKDFSGNGNYWNTNNISITSGSTYDSMTDVPTLTSATAANFAVINPLWKDSGVTVANGNLSVSGGNYGGFSTLTIPTNSKFYAEFTVTTTEGNQGVGILKATNAYSGVLSQADMFGSNSVTYYSTNGNKYVLGGGSTAYGSSWGTVGDVIGIAVNTVDNQITFYKNNTSQGTITGLTSGIEWVFATGNQTSDGGGAWNFGQRPFSYTPPTGFVALNTFNLPTPTIGATTSTQASKYMDINLYTGTGSTLSITNSGFQPDFTWIKSRSNGGQWHALFDIIRGTDNRLFSNTTDAQDTTANTLTAFNSNGFTLGSQAGQNSSGGSYVAWQWRANGTGVSNTAGSITSTVSANTSAGFSIVGWTSNGSNSISTMGHGLGVAPSMIIQHRRSSTGGTWYVYHKSLSVPTDRFLKLNSSDGEQNPSKTLWSVSSSTFGFWQSDMLGNGDTAIAYCFAEVAGYSKFGSYTGNGSADGTFVALPFKPKFVMYKRTDSTGAWFMKDSTRRSYNLNNLHLAANASDAEYTDNNVAMDFLSNGFKLRGTDTMANASGGTYIYMAFAEVPAKFSLGV
jgi:hypothetical protein